MRARQIVILCDLKQGREIKLCDTNLRLEASLGQARGALGPRPARASMTHSPVVELDGTQVL